jgi:hypothetical protein
MGKLNYVGFAKLGSVYGPAIAIVEKTEGFTVDNLKEIIQANVILGEPLAGVIDSIKATKVLGAQEE